MTKATATAKKKKTKRAAAGRSRKPADFDAIRKQIDTLVGGQAVGLVENAITEAKKGHFTSMKYLFEMIGLYPVTGENATPVEDSLAKTLMQRLGVPEEPAPATVPEPANAAPAPAAAAVDTVE